MCLADCPRHFLARLARFESFTLELQRRRLAWSTGPLALDGHPSSDSNLRILRVTYQPFAVADTGVKTKAKPQNKLSGQLGYESSGHRLLESLTDLLLVDEPPC